MVLDATLQLHFSLSFVNDMKLTTSLHSYLVMTDTTTRQSRALKHVTSCKGTLYKIQP